MRIVITGAGGFVGRHLSAVLHERGHEVIASDHHSKEGELEVDVTDALAVRGALELARPDAIAHLAARAAPAASLEDPAATLEVNVRGTLHVLEAARTVASSNGSPRVLIVSSAEVYGAQPQSAYPLRESVAPAPRNPYAATKVAAEALALAYARSYGVDAVVTRAFNHIGPGQDERFAIAAFATQIARVALGGTPGVMVGNLETTRDFLDVRDVCVAYALVLEGGGEPAEVYNVCSGKAVAMREILRRLIEIARVPVQIQEDAARMRPADVPYSAGDASKFREATGWQPRIPLAVTLRDVYADAQQRARDAGDVVRSG